MLRHIVSQGFLSHAVRSAVNQHDELLLPHSEPLECMCVQHLFNTLQLSEVISAANRSQRFIEFRGLQFLRRENLLAIAFPRMFEIESQARPSGELDVPLEQISLEQGHSAADVSADEMRIDEIFRHEGGSDRRSFARMQIRETDGQTHALEFRHRVELAHRFLFDPAFGRSKKAHDRRRWINGLLDFRINSFHARENLRTSEWRTVGKCLKRASFIQSIRLSTNPV